MGEGVPYVRFLDGFGITHRMVSKVESRAVGGYDIKTACGRRWNVLDRHLRKTRPIDCMACAAVGT
jgi:hypothetical protein